jgi:hypothetical protein
MQSTFVAGRRSVCDHHIPPTLPTSFDRALKVLRSEAASLDLDQRLEGRAGVPVAEPRRSQDNQLSGPARVLHSGQLPAVPDNPPSGDADPWAKQKRDRMTNVSNAHDLPLAADGDLGARRQTHEDGPLKLATGGWSA